MHRVTVLNVTFDFFGVPDTVHPVVLSAPGSMVLIDCGYPGSLPALERAMSARGLSCGDLTHVLITHHDHDHMGALWELRQKYPGILVAAGKGEAPYISGELKSLRLRQAEDMRQALPEEQKAFGLAFCEMLKEIRPVPVDLEVREGDRFPWGGGCTILETPGHTPGHISVFIDQIPAAAAGDAAVLEQGRLTVANPRYALDPALAEASLDRLRGCGAAEILCYHGGVFRP